MSAGDPYRPPDADLEGRPGAPPPRPVLGIVTGLVVDFAGTFFFAIVLAVMYGMILANRGLSEEAVMAALESTEILSAYGLISLAMGFAMSFLGGWTCVRVGRVTTLHAPAVLAAIGAALGLWLGGGAYDIGINLMFSLFSAATVMFGAWSAIQNQAALSSPHDREP